MLHPHFTLQGGAGKVAIEQAEILSEKYSVTILCITVAERFRRTAPNVQFVELGGALTDSVRHWVRLPLFLRKLRAVIAEIQPDIIFPQVFPANWWAWYAKKYFPHIPCIWYCHEPSAFIHYKGYIQTAPLFKRLILASTMLFSKVLDVRLTRKYCDFVITNSDFTSNEIQRVYSRKPDALIPPIIDDIFVPAKERNGNTDRILMASRLNRVKNINVALEAMMLLPEEFTLAIAGEGELKGTLIQKVNQADLTNRVKFLGEKNNGELAELYSNSLCLLALSENESFGIAAVESLGCGTPVIATRKGALREIVHDGETGIVLSELTPERVAAAIVHLKNNPKKYREMRSAAVLAADNYRYDNHKNALLQFVENILG